MPAAPRRVALIGFGAIGRLVADTLTEPGDPRIVGVLVREGRAEATAPGLPPGAAAVETLDDLLALAPDLVLECAGQGAVRAHAPGIVARGLDLMLIATGALADHPFREGLVAVAEAAGARILIPAGATAGLDGLGALRIGGLERVRYTSAKPPHAWRGTPAERLIDLGACAARTQFYEGAADRAALDFPQNANLAATIALAGAGFQATTVALVADPALAGNTGRIEAEGAFGRLVVEMAGRAMAGNPKTSAVTALSLVRALRNERGAGLVI